MIGVSKRYPGTLAVDQVDFDLQEGEVHALMGENGAGKSTLMKMMSGAFDDYEGQILLKGSEVKLHTPAIAKSKGIEMIHQELSNAQPLSIAENMYSGNLPKKGFFVDWKKLYEDCRINLEKVGLEADPKTPVEKLSPHEQQLLEIAKAISCNPAFLIMDEPTSSLSSKETKTLFKLIKELKSKGLSIVYISHHIPEIFEVADRVTILRDGKHIDTKEIKDLTPELMVEMMVGKSISKTSVTRKKQYEENLFRFEKLSRFGFFHDISFSVKKGEILGIGGLAGAGRTELARAICGLDPLDFGFIFKNDEAIWNSSYSEAIKNGIAYLSEDRKKEGLALEHESGFNALTGLHVKTGSYIAPGKKQELYAEKASALSIYPAQYDRLINQYSGGNQQKILLAKWMLTDPDLLILDEPTRGVDIGAKQLIHEVIAELADKGIPIILISSDLPELVELSDRVKIIRNGHFIHEFQEDFNEDKILLAANGEIK